MRLKNRWNLTLNLGGLGIAVALTASIAGPIRAETTITSGSVYRIFDMNSGLVLDVPGNTKNSGVQLDQWPANGGANQYWKATEVTGGWTFTNINSGLVLDVPGSSSADGAPVDQATASGGHNQLWTLSAVGDGSYKVVNYHSGKVMEVYASSKSNGAIVDQYTDNNSATQHWAFEEVADGGALPRVYIGGGDNDPGAYNGYLGDPTHWTYVRANADGYYVNNYVVNSGESSHLQQMAGLFTNKNVFYETDFKRSTDATDEANIDILRSYFNVTYATVDEGVSTNRVTALQWRAWRPVLAMVAPWEVGGNFNDSSNATAQANVLSTYGSSTDGPSGYFVNNQTGMQTGCYSLNQFSHSHGVLAELMIATYTSGTNSGTAAANGAAFLKAGQTMVRDCESHAAEPDIWAISYYAAQLQVYQVTPESNADGSAAGTVTGLGYWLIHHLRDPQHYARLDVVPDADTIAETATHRIDTTTVKNAKELIAAANASAEDSVTVLVKSDVTKTLTYHLQNTSSWLDLCPVVAAKIEDPAHQWNVRFTLDGRDVTDAMTKGNGVVCAGDLRLLPDTHRTLKVVMTGKAAGSKLQLAAIHLSLMPHPSARFVVQQRLAVRLAPPASRMVVKKSVLVARR